MFRHMPLAHDTPALREIIIVCCELVGNCQTLSKDGPSQRLNNITFRPFFLLCVSNCPRFPPLFVPLRCASSTCFAHCFHVYQ